MAFLKDASTHTEHTPSADSVAVEQHMYVGQE